MIGVEARKMKKKWMKIGLVITIIIIFINQRRYFTKLLLGNREAGVNILAYHHIVSDEEKKMYWKNNFDVMSVLQFEDHMRYLYEAGYKTLSLDELYLWKNGRITIPEKSIVLTFDDGYTSLVKYVQPILKKYSFHASCFVIGECTGQITKEYKTGRLDYLGLDEIRKENEVFSFYSHGFALHHMDEAHHAKISTMNLNEFKEDLEIQKEITNIDYLAYPWGKKNAQFEDELNELGIKMAFSYANFSSVTPTTNNTCVPRWAIFSYMSVKDIQDILK